MNASIAFFLARRYLFHHQTSSIQTMGKICFASIFISSCSLALVASVMTGFERETHKKMQSIYPSIIIEAPPENVFDMKAFDKLIHNKYRTSIMCTSPYCVKHVIVQSAEDQNIARVALLKGINPQQEHNTTNLFQKLIPSSLSFTSALKGNSIIIGKKLADALDVKRGDLCNLLFSQDDIPSHIHSFTSHKVTIGGLLDTGIADYDYSLVIIHIQTIHNILNQKDISHIGIRLSPCADEEKVMQQLRTDLKGSVYSWKDRYPALVSALKLEKYVMFFLLLLITLVASMNIIALLFMYITHKRGEIALLKTLGLDTTTLIITFACIAMLLSSIATSAGLLFAWIIGTIIKWYHFILLPDIYYVTHLPIALEWPIFILVATVVVLISLCATILPIRTIHTLNITQTLRKG